MTEMPEPAVEAEASHEDTGEQIHVEQYMHEADYAEEDKKQLSLRTLFISKATGHLEQMTMVWRR